MDLSTIILIISNIAIPIITAIITGLFTSKKYKKEIDIINATAENRIKEIEKEYQHKADIQNITHQNELECMKIQFEHENEFEKQRSGINIVETLTAKLSDEIIKQPATQKMISQRTTHNFLQKKSRRK